MDHYSICILLFMITCSGITLAHGYSSDTAVTRDYCIKELFQPDCGQGVIIINSAFYGRMKLGSCITQGYGVVGCQSNVTDIINQECFAKKTCSMDVMDDRLFHTVPCGELTSYLEVSYTCLQVITSPREVCGNGDLLKISSPSSGYLSSTTSKETGCGGRTSPWLIESPDGRPITITLLDMTHSGEDASRTSICLVYASIKEAGGEQSTTVCGGQSRERLVYQSRGDVIQVTIVSRERQFLLRYEFVGCPSMDAEEGMTQSRDGNVTRVSCDDGEAISNFRCNGTRWVGQLPNCTQPHIPAAADTDPDLHISEKKTLIIDGRNKPKDNEISSDEEEMVAFNFESITWGMVLIVIGIITGGIVACVFIISVVYLKRKSIECKAPILVPRPVSEAGYEVCDFDISQCTSSVYRDGYLTVPKDYTPMMNGTMPKYKKTDVWERPLPAEPNLV